MKKILLIEDNLEVRENTAEILELADYEVISAQNGKEGVELAKREIPDLILCDIMMPELDGYGVLYLLAKNPDTAGIPFIFLTAKAEKSDFRKGMNMGADDYLTKPFEEMELLNAVETRLKRNESFKKDYSRSEEGLNQFISEARGMAELDKLSKDRRTKDLRKKDILYHRGDYPNNLYFINKGKVKTWTMNDDGKELVTGLYNEGEFIGYMPLVEESPYKESATALEDTEVSIIPKDDFNLLIRSNRDVSHRFIKMLANNIEEKQERLLQLAYGSVRERVAESLLMLEKRYNTGIEESFSISITREDLAAIVGTATESLIRTLSDFKEEKLIEIKGREIVILDNKGLKKIITRF